MIYFFGTSFAAKHLKAAAKERGLPITEDRKRADLVFISQDTPTDENGARDLEPIKRLIEAGKRMEVPLVLTSQVPPGFTRSLGIPEIFHQAETLRISDAEERALNPEQIIVGGEGEITEDYWEYLSAFDCPIVRMSWEEAEFAKIAINMTLASQVENANRLSKAAEKVGARWENVVKALKLDKRIGPYSYLTPGRWQDSKHLLRDSVTLEAI